MNTDSGQRPERSDFERQADELIRKYNAWPGVKPLVVGLLQNGHTIDELEEEFRATSEGKYLEVDITYLD